MMIKTSGVKANQSENIIGNAEDQEMDMDMGMGNLSISKMQTRQNHKDDFFVNAGVKKTKQI